jgi:magnesium transporter
VSEGKSRTTLPRTMPTEAEMLASQVVKLGPAEAADALERHSDAVVAEVLQRINPSVAGDIIPELEPARRSSVFNEAPHAVTQQWSRNLTFEEDSIGRLMEPVPATFRPDETVRAATQRVREVAKRVMLTYLFVVDAQGMLVGVVTMRDLVVAEDDDARLETLMLRDVFALSPAAELSDAMRLVVHRHYPVYPVTDEAGHLIGQVRGSAMFEEQAIEFSAQPGRMVGVAEEERLLTPWSRSLRFRHPWLQLNLLTAFIAAGVVGFFQQTLDNMVILALFLPVLAGQSGNTGCQALAVTLRGLTLGELKPGTERALVAKEALLGLLNGALVGITAGTGMYIVATMQGTANAIGLAGIVALAMIGSCVVSGISGALIPLTLRRVGADPATASSIFLTTATDVASMGLFLGLATLLLV